MKREELEKTFEEAGVIRGGHFLLSSGLHSGIYFEKFRLLENPELTTEICQEIADEFADADISRIAGPTVGGIVVAHEVARLMGKKWLFAERVEEGRDFRRGFRIEKGENILVVDDVLTTGASILDTTSAVERRKGKVAAVAVLVDRREEDSNLPFRLFSVYRSRAKNFSPRECPLCRKGVRLEKPGSSQRTGR
ncbi:MAG: orotate phosphoribosyltransferase [bacterium]